MKNDMLAQNAILILLRFAIAASLFCATGLCAYGYWTAKEGHLLPAAGVGAFVTFVCGVFFASSALDESLWMPSKPARRADDEDEDTAIEETAIKQ